MKLGPRAFPPPIRLADAVESVVPGIIRDVRTDLVGVLAAHPGTTLVNWWRSAEHNREVGGAELSQHRIGLAVDLVPGPGERAKVIAWMRAANWQVIDEHDHLHFQAFRATPNVKRFVEWAARFA